MSSCEGIAIDTLLARLEAKTRLKTPFTGIALCVLVLAAGLPPALAQNGAPVTPEPVTVKNFARAESHMYFARTVAGGGFGKLQHDRAPVAIDDQKVIRMNRDTLYSSGVFDLDAGPVTIVLPDTGKRFMSLLVLNEDHYAQSIVYAPGRFTFSRKDLGTRYMFAAVRTLANATDAQDITAANAVQDRIQVQQKAQGKFEIPAWDATARDHIREALLVLAARSGAEDAERFGRREAVDPIQHLLYTASGWGGNPRKDAVYLSSTPKANDGATIHRLRVGSVPVDGFWSISVYNAKGFFEKNPFDSYSLNNLTAQANSDGSYTIQFGGCSSSTPDCLVTPPGWSYVVRLYRPRKAVLDGTWKFPEAVPAVAQLRTPR